MGSLSNLGPAFENILPSFNLADLLFGAVFGVGMRLVVYFKSKNAKKFRKGEEYGSARWGNAKDIEPYMDLNDPENNVILTQTEGLIMNGKPKGPKYARNKNILVIGGSGSGADTACVLLPSYTAKLFETKISEILCKPGLME